MSKAIRESVHSLCGTNETASSRHSREGNGASYGGGSNSGRCHEKLPVYGNDSRNSMLVDLRGTFMQMGTYSSLHLLSASTRP